MSKNRLPVGKHFIPLLFIFLGIGFFYYNSLHNSFFFDDHQITDRTNLHLNRLDFESIKGTFYFTPNQKQVYRPISCLSLGLNYYFGGINPFGYHLVNISIHIICTFAVYYFLYTFLSIPGLKPHSAAKYRYEITVIATFLFAFHPLQTNVASYIIQRMTSFAALFYVISITGYIHFRLCMLNAITRSTMKIIFSLCVFLLSGLFAVLSKENAIFLPVMILVIDYLFFFPLSPQNLHRKIKIGYIVVIFLLLCTLAYVGPKYYFQFIEVYQTRAFSPLERLLTQARIIFFYLYLIFSANQNLMNLNHDFSLSKGLLSPPQTLISIFGIFILFLLFFKLKKQRNLFSFAIAWYFGNLIIESTFVPLELVYEHRTYLPGVLIYLLMAFTIVYISKRLNKNYIMVIFTTFLLVLYGHGIYLRNMAFRRPLALWLDVVEKSPGYDRGYANLGRYYWETGHPIQAKTAYERALELNPDMVEPMMNLARLNMNYIKDTKAALQWAKKALRSNPKDARAPNILADVYMRLKDYRKAEHYYELSLKRYLYNPGIMNNLGIVKIHIGEKNEAAKIFLGGIRMDPSYENLYLNLAKLYANENRYQDAENVLNTYLSRNKSTKNMTRLLKDINKKRSDFESAKKNSDSKN